MRGMARKGDTKGKLRIGDDWNAIRIIALSQSNPLKAVAELVENSIDARARAVTITRGREHGNHYLAIRDDGDGVPRDEQGVPDFKYVATHICDSIKRKLKVDGGGTGLQGEFGIGLLSFWTVGERLQMTSTGTDQRAYQMTMTRGEPIYEVVLRRTLFAERGTELKIAPLLDGIRTLNGEKIQWYLASELRDRIRSSGVRITVIDKLARKQYAVEPRQFDGRLLHQLPLVRTAFGDVYAELYLADPSSAARVGVYRSGTRVLEDVGTLPTLDHGPWSSGYLQGLLDAPFLNLTPGTRSGIIYDDRLTAFYEALQPLERHLQALIDEQRRAEEEHASRELLRTIQRAFREAMLALPPEEYDWFDIQARSKRSVAVGGAAGRDANVGAAAAEDELLGATEPDSRTDPQRRFFEHAGPLFSVIVSPSASTVAVGEARRFTALPRDRARRRVEEDLEFSWAIADGGGSLRGERDQQVEFAAPELPGLTRLAVTVRQRTMACMAEALITVTASIATAVGSSVTSTRGLPGYTFERAAGELWRSRFDADRNVIIVNNGHRDFVFATRNQALKLRYLVRLYIKELVLRNFEGLPAEQLLERMIELSLYTEGKL
jgi:hypothetical protein